ncbi:hypothetical protein D3C80_1247690 [compost metagenome]
MPQAVFQQQQVDRGHGVATTEKGAGLQQAQCLFPSAIGNVRSMVQRIQPLTQLEYQFEAAFRQLDFVDLRLPLVILLVGDAQGFRHRVFILVLAADQQRAKVLLVLHFVQPQAYQHAVVQRFQAAVGFR